MSNYTLELLLHIKEMVDFLYGNYSSLTIKEFREEHPDIEWRDMAGMRDILIHDYDNVDYDILWNVLNSKIPLLKLKIDKLIKEYS